MELDTLNLTKMCRTCKCISPQMHPLFPGYENPDKSSRIDEMLMACTFVLVIRGDGLPDQICQVCLEQLQNAFAFKCRVERIDADLREYAKNVKVTEIKQELQDWNFIEDEMTDSASMTGGNNNDNDHDSNTEKVTDCLENEIESSSTQVKLEDTFDIENDYLEEDSVADIQRAAGKNSGDTSSEYLLDKSLSSEIKVSSINIKTEKKGEENHEQELQKLNFIEPLNTFNSLLNEHIKENDQEQSDSPSISNTETDYIKILDNDQMLTCRECPKIFSTIKGLRHHKRLHTGNLHKCSKCDKQFTRLDHLHRHENLHNSRKKVHVCKICGKTLVRPEYLNRHLAIHLKDKPFSCKTCNRVFNRIEYLNNHMFKCKGDLVYRCDICHKAFNREDTLEVHRKLHEDQPNPVTVENLDNAEQHYYQLDQDDDTLLSDYSDVDDGFELQLEVTESMGKKRIKETVDTGSNDEVITDTSSAQEVTECLENEVELTEVKLEEVCDIEENIQEGDSAFNIENDAGENSVDSGNLLNRSLSPQMKRGRGRPRKNPSSPKKMPGRGRGRPPVQVKKEKMEIQYREKAGEKKYECSLCPKRFTTEKYRDFHLNGHNDQKEHQCRVCEETFPSKFDLVAHNKLHKDRVKKFLCTECGQRFTRNDYLIIHIRRHRGEKPFKCKFCGKGFTRTTDLVVHERYHTGEKTHLCTICGRGFARAYNLKLHMRTHTGERPYQCTHCTAAFAQSNDLKVHIRRVHTGERYRCELCNDTFYLGYRLTHHKRTVHGLSVINNSHHLQVVPKQESQDEPPPLIPLVIKREAPDGNLT